MSNAIFEKIYKYEIYEFDWGMAETKSRSRGGGGGLFLGILGGVCRPVLQIRPKNVIFHTRFQTRPLKSIPVFTPGYVIII